MGRKDTAVPGLDPVEEWIDQPDSAALGPEDQHLTRRLTALRRDYQGLRYQGPMPMSQSAGSRRRWWLPGGGWRLAFSAAAAAIAIVAIGISAALWEPWTDPVTEPVDANWQSWNPQSPAARMRALRSEMKAAVRRPELPETLGFRLPPRPTRPSGYTRLESSRPADGSDSNGHGVS